MGISKEKIKADVNVNVQTVNINIEDRRSKLADLAETLARQNIIGTPGINDIRKFAGIGRILISIKYLKPTGVPHLYIIVV